MGTERIGDSKGGYWERWKMWMPLIEDALSGHGGASQVANRAMGWSNKRTMEGHGIHESHRRDGHSGFTVAVDRELEQGASDLESPAPS